MVVDDHRLLRQELRSLICAYEGFEVVGEAEDGQEACELAKQLRPDVILMDVHMPKMNGRCNARDQEDASPYHHYRALGQSEQLNGLSSSPTTVFYI